MPTLSALFELATLFIITFSPSGNASLYSQLASMMSLPSLIMFDKYSLKTTAETYLQNLTSLSLDILIKSTLIYFDLLLLLQLLSHV